MYVTHTARVYIAVIYCNRHHKCCDIGSSIMYVMHKKCALNAVVMVGIVVALVIVVVLHLETPTK